MSDYSNLLHTKSTYAQEENYINILSRNINNFNPTEKIDEQINILQEQEQQFYSDILGENIKDINTFLKKVRERTQEVQKCFYRLSSFDKKEGLFQYTLENLSLNQDLLYTSKNKKETTLLNQNNFNTAIQIQEFLTINMDTFVNTDGGIKVTFSAGAKKGGKSNSQTINLSPVFKQFKKDFEKSWENMTLRELKNEIIPKIVKMLLKGTIIDGKSFQLREGLQASVPQLINSLEKNILEQLTKNKEIVSEELYQALFHQGVGLKSQQDFFTKKKNKMTSKNYDKFKQVLLDYLIQGIENPTDFINAFNRAWNDSNSEKIIQTFYQKGSSNFTGIMGELGGLILLYYLNPNASTIKWTGAKQNIYGEQNRADILYGSMGIQVKNYKEKTINNFNVAIKLHPLELLDRLAMNHIGKLEENTIKNILANMAFNEDIEDIAGYKEGLIEILKYYMGSTLNLNLTKEERDASNFWLVGGNMLIPGSEILRSFKYRIEDKESVNIKLKFPENRKNDLQFSYEKAKEDSSAPLFTEYWRSYGFSPKGPYDWRPYNGEDAEGNKKTYENLINSNKISIQTQFRFSDLFDMKAIKNFSFI